MHEFMPFISCFPTPKFLGEKAGIQGVIGNMSLSRAYANGLLARHPDETLYAVSITYSDAFNDSWTRWEVIGLTPQLKGVKGAVVIENVPGAPESNACLSVILPSEVTITWTRSVPPYLSRRPKNVSE